MKIHRRTGFMPAYVVRTVLEIHTLVKWMHNQGISYTLLTTGEFSGWAFEVHGDHVSWFEMRWGEEIA